MKFVFIRVVRVIRCKKFVPVVSSSSNYFSVERLTLSVRRLNPLPHGGLS